MNSSRLAAIAFLLVTAVGLSASTPTVTLYPPVDPVTKKYDEGKSHFSFKRGLPQEITKSNGDWDLSYGGWIINGDDWFGLHFGAENLSVIKDLGEFNWDEPLSIPVLEARSPAIKGEQWQATVVTSDPNGAWTRSGQYAKVALDHMYLMHVKDDAADFYVMFHVEDFELHKHCTISWRMIPSPKSAQGAQH